MVRINHMVQQTVTLEVSWGKRNGKLEKRDSMSCLPLPWEAEKDRQKRWAELTEQAQRLHINVAYGHKLSDVASIGPWADQNLPECWQWTHIGNALSGYSWGTWGHTSVMPKMLASTLALGVVVVGNNRIILLSSQG